MKIKTHIDRRPKGITKSTWFKHLKLNCRRASQTRRVE
jgi:hypothetical protein